MNATVCERKYISMREGVPYSIQECYSKKHCSNIVSDKSPNQRSFSLLSGVLYSRLPWFLWWYPINLPHQI